MRYLIILHCIFLSSCYTFNKINKKEELNPNETPSISVKYEDIDTNGDNNISAAEFSEYKESTKKGLVNPNVDYIRPLTIALFILGGITILCLSHKGYDAVRATLHKGKEKSKELWKKHITKK